MVHVLLDAFGVRAGSSAVVVEGLLRGWEELATGDRITVVSDQDPPFTRPKGSRTVIVRPPVGGPAGTLWSRTVAVRRVAREERVDGVLSGVPASALLGTGCRRGVVLYDLRHELRPEQFPVSRRVARRLLWGLSLRRADGIYTISERTLGDLARLHPSLAHKGEAARLGADHVDAWPSPTPAEPPYALAFGHFANKNVSAVLAGWQQFCATDEHMRLRLVGMGRADRDAAADQVRRLGIEHRVELMPWLDDERFAECFAAASLVVFPSDFEGFGLPAVEAMRLGIPVVVSSDPALAEVTGGFAATAASTTPDELARAMREALSFSPERLAAGRAHTDAFTWRGAAAVIRASLFSS